MPIDFHRLTEGWLELESDPGLFTLLLEDFGVKGVQVEEIYDLQKSLEDPVYGFIFLFRWIEERRSRRKEQDEIFVKDENTVNNIFFAHQVVPNSCATHALLSILLNCPNIHLGTTLSRLKLLTTGMCPENKGWAIGNTLELACAHNSHAMPQAKRRQNKNTSGVASGRFTGEAFHFVSFVPINGRLFELDGLKPFPMDHGPWAETEEWTEQFKRVITDRLGISSGEQLQDIRFNLMAVVPDRRLAISHKLTMLKTNRQIVLEALQQLVKLTNHNSENANNKNNISNNSSNINEIEKSDKIIDKKEKTEQESNIVEKSEIEESNPIPIISIERCNDVELASTTSITTSDIEKAVNGLDETTTLQIQTSPAHSSSSTDTSSEIGSAFNSPLQGWGWNSNQLSPTTTKDFKKLVVIKVAVGDEKNESKLSHSLNSINLNGKRLVPDNSKSCKKVCLSSEKERLNEKVKTSSDDAVLEEKKDQKMDPPKYSEILESNTFAPKDLLALLKNLEQEIGVCETALKDENDKRTKYKVDDCRRTHNYDEFICTFLSMLAKQGKLAELVQQHSQLKKPSIALKSRATKKVNTNRAAAPRRRRGRTKQKRKK